MGAVGSELDSSLLLRADPGDAECFQSSKRFDIGMAVAVIDTGRNEAKYGMNSLEIFGTGRIFGTVVPEFENVGFEILGVSLDKEMFDGGSRVTSKQDRTLIHI